MFGIGETEFAIILLFGFLLFGPDKLPGMGRTIGRALRQFREAQEDLNKVVQTEIVEPMEDVTKSIKFDDAAPESDSDRTSTSSEVKKESFAEKKARLQKEAKQAHDKKDETCGDAQKDDAVQTKQDLDLEDKAENEKAETKPSAPSAFDLYGLSDADSHRGKEA